MSLSNDRYITVTEAREFLGVTAETVLRWLREYGIKHIRAGKNAGRTHTTLIWKPDFDAFVEEHTVTPKPTKAKRGRPPRLHIAGE